MLPGVSGRLAATLETSTETPTRWALLCHGFGSRKEFKPLAKISSALAMAGWGAVRFDFAGNGTSEGRFEEMSFATQQADVRSVHRWLATQAAAPDLLIGHSLGGATLLSVGHELPARQLVTIGAPSDTSHLADHLIAIQPLLNHGDAEIVIAGVPRLITSQLLDSLRATGFSQQIEQLHQRLLVIQPEEDDTIAPDHATRIATCANQPDAVQVLEGSDHLLSRDADIGQAIDWILAWIV